MSTDQMHRSASDRSTRRAAKLVGFGFFAGAVLAMLLMFAFRRAVIDVAGWWSDARRASRAVVLLDAATIVQDGKTIGHLKPGVVLLRSGSGDAGMQELTLRFSSEGTVGPRFGTPGQPGSTISTVLLAKQPRAP